MPYIEVFTETYSLSSSNRAANNQTRRQLILGADIPADFYKVKVTLGSGSDDLEFDRAYIGHQGSGGNDWDFDGNQEQLLFSASGSGTVSGAYGTLESDELEIEITAGGDVIIAVDLANSGKVYVPYADGDPESHWSKNSSDTAADTAPSGLSATDYERQVVCKVEGLQRPRISFKQDYDETHNTRAVFKQDWDVRNLWRISFQQDFDIRNLWRISFQQDYDISAFVRLGFTMDWRELLRIGYNVYHEQWDELGGTLESTSDLGFVATGGSLSKESGALVHGKTHMFRVHAQNELFEERDPANAVVVVLKDDGSEDSARPNKVRNITITNLASGEMKLEWDYDPANEQLTPTQFRIWESTSTPVSTAGDPAYTVTYKAHVSHYSKKTGAKAQDTYYFIIRAANDSVDDGSTDETTNTNDATAPASGWNIRGDAV